MSTEQTARKPSRRWLWTLLSLVLIVCAVLVALRLTAMSKAGRAYVEARIEAMRPAGQEIDIDGLKGDLLGRFTIERLRISDKDGIWFELENLHVVWHPADLTGRNLNIDLVSVEKSLVHRRPELVRSESGGNGDFPLNTIRLGNLQIAELNLNEAITTRALRLSTQGAGAWRGDEAELALTLAPLDGEGDRIDGDLTWSRQNRLQGELHFESPPGGLIASLAQMEPDQALSGDLRGAGALDDWTGDLAVRVDDSPTLTLSARSEEDWTVYSGTADFSALPKLDRVAVWLGSPLELSGRVRPGAQGTVDLETSLAADRLRAEGVITRDRHGALSGTLQLSAAEPHRLADLSGAQIGTLTLEGQITSTEAGQSFSGDIAAQALSRGSLRMSQLSGPLALRRTETGWQVETQLATIGADLPEALQRLTGSRPDLTFAGSASPGFDDIEVDNLTLSGRAVRLTTAGQIDPALSARTALNGTMAINGAAAQYPYSIALAGDWRVSGTAAGDFNLDLQSRASGTNNLPAPLDQLLGPQTQLHLTGTATRQSELTLSRLSLDGQHADLNGTLVLGANRELTLDAKINTDALLFSGVETTPLSADLTASGPIDALAFSLAANTEQVQRRELALSAFDVQATGQLTGRNLTAQINASGNTETGSAELSADVGLSGSAWQIEDLDLRLAGLTAQGNVSGIGADLPSLRATLTASGPLPESLPGDTVDATLTLTGEQIESEGRMMGLSAGPVSADSLSWDISGTPEHLDLSAQIRGDAQVNGTALPLRLNLVGQAEHPLTEARAFLFDVNGDLADQRFRTLETARLVPSPRGVEASLTLSALGGTLHAIASDDPAERIRLDVEGITLEALLPLIGELPRRGVLSGTARLQDDGEQLAGTLQAKLTGLYTLAGAEAPLDLVLTGQLMEERLDLAANSHFEDSLDGSARLTIPVITRAEPLMIKPAENAVMPFVADLAGPIAPLADLVLNPDLALSGMVDLALHGALPLKENGAEGVLVLTEGGFEDARAGFGLTDVSLRVDISREQLALQDFQATGRSGGQVSGGGHMSLTNGSTNMELAADQLVVFDRAEGRMVASGEVGLNREAERINLTGDLEIIDGTLNLDRLPTSGPPTLKVRFDAPDPDEKTEPTPEPVTNLSVNVRSPHGVRLTGHGIEASLVLDVEITGSLGAPRIIGTGEVQRGRFDLLGKRFEVQGSQIRINGDPDEADLAIRAVREDEDLTVEINVRGTPRQPEVTLSSNPALPQDEVLSRLLFGRSPAELGPLETARLAAALAELSGGGGFDLLGGIEESLNLDTVDIGQNGDGGFELTTGKYLAEDVYLELRSSPDAPPGIALEWQPLDNIEVELETTSNTGQNVSVRWKHDFD